MKAFNENETEKYLDFNVHSQTLFADNGDVAMVFPQLENGKVTELYAAVLTENMTLLGLHPLNHSWSGYDKALRDFQAHYSQQKQTASQKFDTMGIDEETEINEVIIIAPSSGGFGGGGELCDSGGEELATGVAHYDSAICPAFDLCAGAGADLDLCAEAAKQNAEAKKVTSNPKYQLTMEAAVAAALACKCETSFSFGWKDGKLQVTQIKEGGATSSIPVNTSPDFTISGRWHYHPDNATEGTENCFAPSPGDIYALHGSHTANPNITLSLVTSIKGTYALSITNFAQLNTFVVIDFPRPCPTCADWKYKSIVYNAREYAEYSFIGQSKSSDDAYALAQAGVMSQFDMGVSQSKLDANGNFNSQYVNNAQNPNGSPENIYTQTTNCNLNK
jgi:hypothetical protein